jgi:enoyl-CoA hydratase/carnithine racemase
LTVPDRYRSIQVEIEGRLATVRLNRPERGNRIDSVLAAELAEAFTELAHEVGIWAAVLLAAGPDFCLGEDPEDPPPNRGPWVRPAYPGLEFSEAVAAYPRPLVAGIQGRCSGVGLELALCADIRVASRDAVFALDQLQQGTLPRFGGTQRLPRVVGRGRALDLILTGRGLPAAEAEQIGLVTRLVDGDVEAAARQVAEEVLANGPLGLMLAKEAVWRGLELPLHQALRVENDLYLLLETTADRLEGKAAFLERRRPVWHGR